MSANCLDLCTSKPSTANDKHCQISSYFKAHLGHKVKHLGQYPINFLEDNTSQTYVDI